MAKFFFNIFCTHIIATHIECYFQKFESKSISHYEVMIFFSYILYNQALLQEDLKKENSMVEIWAAVTPQPQTP